MTAKPPRTILYTGKGGVGKTSVAAATARRCAASGLRTIVLSTDPAHSLSDSLERELGPDPTRVGERLWGQEVRAERELEANWDAVRRWLAGGARRSRRDGHRRRGADGSTRTRRAVQPSADQAPPRLRPVRGRDRRLRADRRDAAPALVSRHRALVARQGLSRRSPGRGRRGPLARTLLDLELPDDDVLGEVRSLVANLIAMNEILQDRRRASIRLVMNPDRMVIKEAQRTFTYLNLYGYLTDAVIVNRVFPDELEGGYFDAWRAHQRERLAEVSDGFAPVPVLSARYFEEEVVGARMLDRLAGELFDEPGGGPDPADVLHTQLARELESANGTATLRIPVPFGERGDVSLRQAGAELIVAVGHRKRIIILPAGLARLRPALGLRTARSRSGSRRDPMVAPEAQPQCIELCPICRGAEVLRATSSPELRGQWQSVQREALLTMRTMIDRYLDRLAEADGRPARRVEEIPID